MTGAVALVVLLAALLVLVLLAWYLSYTAARLDRLHTRAEGALSALDGQLVRRAEAALALASSGLLDPASSLAVAGEADACLAAGPFAGDTLDEPGLVAASADRAERESALSHALREALDPDTVSLLVADDDGCELLDRLAGAWWRAHLAGRFHADAVEDALRVRRKAVVRLLRLAGHAALPSVVDLDDRLPEGLGPERTMTP